MASATTLIDGTFLAPTPVGAPRYQYPFRDNGDRITAFFEQDFWQTQATFTPQEFAVPHETFKDFYLVEETPPVPLLGGMAGLLMFTRTYSRIPVPQTVPSSLYVTKPDVSTGSSIGILLDYSSFTVSSGGVTITGPLSNPACYEYLGRLYGGNTFFSDISGASSLTAATGGTFTLTYKTSTTAALNWNDSGATIAAALNALASVIADSLTFTVVNALNTTTSGPRLTLTLTAGTTSTAVTMNAASLTPAGAKTAFGLCTSLTAQFVAIGARVTLTAHGFSGGVALAAYQNSGVPRVVVYPTSLWAVVDANTIAFAYQGTQNGDGAFTKFGQAISAYSAGSSATRVKYVSTFYLPGVTPGITTIDDIPLPTFQGDPASILNAILSGSTTLNYQVGDLKIWKGPIYERVTTTLNPTQLA